MDRGWRIYEAGGSVKGKLAAGLGSGFALATVARFHHTSIRPRRMPFEAIVREVDQLHNVGTLLEALAKQHPFVSEAHITIAGDARNTATLLAVLVATRSPKPI